MSAVAYQHGRWQDSDYWFIAAPPHPLVFYAPQRSIALALNRTDLPGADAALPEQIVARLDARPLLEPAAQPATSFHLGVGLTRDCTLACTYCHADAGTQEHTPDAVLDAAIQHAFTRAARTPARVLSASFAVGGEPTFRWRAFVDTVRKLRAAPDPVKRVFLSITTNAFYGDVKRAFVGDNFDTITVSIDGPTEIHDRHRPTRSGGGSYRVIADSIAYWVAKSSARLALRATVSDHSVTLLPEIVDHFVHAFGTRVSIAFEPLVEIGRAAAHPRFSSPPMDVFTERFLAARERGAALGVRVISSGSSITRLIRRFCGAMSIPSFAVCVDGSITACHRDQDAESYGYGWIDADGQVQVDSAKLENLASLNDLPVECETCFARWHCAGDCPDLRRAKWSRCDFNRALVLDDISRVLARTKGGETNARACK